MNQSVKVRLDQGDTKGVKTGTEFGERYLFVTDFTLTQWVSYQGALEGFGDFTIHGQVIITVKYADDLVLLAKEETVLQGMLIV
jgi:hypothetical protein